MGGGGVYLRMRSEGRDRDVGGEVRGEEGRTYPAGCCIIDTKSSTAVLAAILANPGLVTVHI